MAISSSLVRRLPLTTAILYLAVGFGIGPHGLNLLEMDPLESARFLERATELGVIISLFTAGLKLRLPLKHPSWKLALRLATVSMVLTVGMIAALTHFWFGLPIGAGILLGAILAPTDPVLASDVQLGHAEDKDRLRFSLTGEAGLNDGTAFPFVMLGLGLLGAHEIGGSGIRWFTTDLLYAIAGGLGVGVFFGAWVSKLLFRLRAQKSEAIILDDFLALSLIALSYGTALLMHVYGFLAVFAAALTLRQVERSQTGGELPEDVNAIAKLSSVKSHSDPKKSAALTAQAVLVFNEQLERIAEVSLVLLFGAMFRWEYLNWESIGFALILFFIIRPTAVWAGLIGHKVPGYQKYLIGWFGVRGVGSFYYLMYAIQYGLSTSLAQQFIVITFNVVVLSVVVHGFSVTPLMKRYEKLSSRLAKANAKAA